MRDINKNGIPDGVEEFAADRIKELRELGRDARKRADEAKSEAVKGLHNVAETIRKEAREKGAQGESLKGVDEVATQLERAAGFLKRHSYEEIGGEVQKTVKKNAVPMLAFIFVVGVIIGLILRGEDRK